MTFKLANKDGHANQSVRVLNQGPSQWNWVGLDVQLLWLPLLSTLKG